MCTHFCCVIHLYTRKRVCILPAIYTGNGYIFSVHIMVLMIDQMHIKINILDMNVIVKSLN